MSEYSVSWKTVDVRRVALNAGFLFIAFFSLFVSYEVGMDVSGDVGVCYQSIDTDELSVVSHEEPESRVRFYWLIK